MNQTDEDLAPPSDDDSLGALLRAVADGDAGPATAAALADRLREVSQADFHSAVAWLALWASSGHAAAAPDEAEAAGPYWLEGPPLATQAASAALLERARRALEEMRRRRGGWDRSERRAALRRQRD